MGNLGVGEDDLWRGVLGLGLEPRLNRQTTVRGRDDRQERALLEHRAVRGEDQVEIDVFGGRKGGVVRHRGDAADERCGAEAGPGGSIALDPLEGKGFDVSDVHDAHSHRTGWHTANRSS